MATKTWFVTNNKVSVHQEMSETSPGSEATSSPNYGWAVPITGTPPLYSKAAAGVERANSTFAATPVEPDGSIDTTLGDCWRTTNKYTGVFAAGDWTFQMRVIAVSAGGSQDGRAGFRLFRGTNADGTGATEITSARQVGSDVVNLTTSAAQTSSVVVTLSAVTLNDEYLFVQIGWEATGLGASHSQSDADHRVGTGASLVTSTDFFVEGAAAINGLGAITAAGTVATTVNGAAVIDGVGAVAAAGSFLVEGVASINALGAVDSAGSFLVGGAAAINGIGAVAAAGSMLVDGQSLVAALGGVAASGTVSGFTDGAAALAAEANMLPAATLLLNGLSAIAALAAVSASGTVAGPAGFVDGAALLTAEGRIAALVDLIAGESYRRRGVAETAYAVRSVAASEYRARTTDESAYAPRPDPTDGYSERAVPEGEYRERSAPLPSEEGTS